MPISRLEDWGGVFFDAGGAVFHPEHEEYGAAGNGSTDDRAALAATDTAATAVGGAIQFRGGKTYLVGSTLAFSADVGLRFPPGAKLKPASGITVTINGPIFAGAYQIFDTSAGGTIVLGAGVTKAHAEWFGTTGAAIKLAIAAHAAKAKGKVEVGPGSWNVPTAIRGAEGIEVAFDNEAVLVPTDDVNVLEVVRGSRFRHPHIDVSTFAGYSAAAIYFDGVTVPINLGNAKAEVIAPWILGNQEGTALHLYCADGVDTTPKLEWVHVERPRIRRMHTAISLEGAPFSYLLGGRYVHTIQITAPQMSGCVRFIDILGKSGGHNITDIAIQCANDTESVLYCEGGGSLITGRIWDMQLSAVEQPIVFTPESTSNICVFPTLNAYRIKDLGFLNSIWTTDNSKAPQLALNVPGTAEIDGGYGDQDDALAWADQDYTVTQSSGDATNVSTFTARKQYLFDLTRDGNYVSWAASASAQVVEIDFGAELSGWRALAVYFGDNGPATEVKIEADLDGAGDWVTLFESTANIEKMVTAYFAHVSAQSCWKLRFTLKNTTDQIQLDRIWGYRNSEYGKAWLAARHPVTHGFVLGASGSPITQDRKHTPSAWNTGSIAAGAYAQTTRSTSGVAVGDVVIGSGAHVSLGGLILDVDISNTDEFTITLTNPTGSPIDPPSLDLTIWVRKG